MFTNHGQVEDLGVPVINDNGAAATKEMPEDLWKVFFSLLKHPELIHTEADE